ncbi:hypothetical protein BVRB_7g161030 [Beta vulgaris subsp. vulgaris]|nr:hypothetical protein BVRB_7g161030 [Beta vulgaris subsp. vulgaris]
MLKRRSVKEVFEQLKLGDIVPAHGMPERKMGAAVGKECALLDEVCGWVNAKATVPVWAKMTPNVTDIREPARVALESGCEGIAAINTIMSVMGINLTTLRPEPCVEGYSTPGGYSSKAVHPIALAKLFCVFFGGGGRYIISK